MDATAEVDRLLKDAGAILKRNHRHEVWQLPNGHIFVRAKSPSNRDEAWKDLADLRRALGIKNEGNGQGERRAKKIKGEIRLVRERIEPSINTALADKLRLAGVAENRLQGDIEFLQAENGFLKQEILDVIGENEQMEALLLAYQLRPCLCVRCQVKLLVAAWIGWRHFPWFANTAGT